jgi:hypothetical protein
MSAGPSHGEGGRGPATRAAGPGGQAARGATRRGAAGKSTGTLGERAARGHPVEAQVMFLVAGGGVLCRKPGRQHGFADYSGALAWVERNTDRAHPPICAFVIELW